MKSWTFLFAFALSAQQKPVPPTPCQYRQAQLDRFNSMERAHTRTMTQPKVVRELLPCTIEEMKKKNQKPPASHTPVSQGGKNG